jgi:enamine deaminase RidA (YjgF/YER057c/UK114 family)
VYERLKELGITIVPPAAPVAAFVNFTVVGNVVYVSGHIAKRDGKPWVGRLGADLDVAEGKAAARAVAIDLLGTLEAAAGSLERVKRLVKLLVLVNAAPTFTEPHLVANGASELLVDVFGPQGQHARSAIGVAQLPFGSCVEIELIAELKAALNLPGSSQRSE